MAITESLVFKVRRHEPQLIRPAKPTPREFKKLSDIDDQDNFRFQIPVLQVYKCDPKMQGRDPVEVIRQAIARTLVFYYPFAGRIREWPRRKLVVECNEEGVLFIEADADVSLEELRDALQPPITCMEELLFDVPGSAGILHCPLLLIQVTRLKCGGFIFGLRLNHTMSDAEGLIQFMKAVGEVSQGADTPSILPVWQRELLEARNPPQVTFPHHEYAIPADLQDYLNNNGSGDKVPFQVRSFFFGHSEMSSLRTFLPQHLRGCTAFELLTACIWRCRISALQPNPEEEVRVLFAINARTKFNNPPLPAGYYGNVLAHPVARTTARLLCENPLGYALELVRKAKASVTQEYMRSLADLTAIRGRPPLNLVRAFALSDVTRLGFYEVDFGWGEPIYGGPVNITSDYCFGFFMPFKNLHDGREGTIVVNPLPAPAMERFVHILDGMLKGHDDQIQKGSIIKSTL